MSTTEQRIQELARHMVLMELACITKGFSFKEGYAMFQGLADCMKLIESTNGTISDEDGVAIMYSKVKSYLGEIQ